MQIADLSGKYFSKMSVEDEVKTLSVLLDRNARESARFGMACTFCYYGYDIVDTMAYVQKYAKWGNFDIEKTRTHIRKVYTWKQRNRTGAAQSLTKPFLSAPILSDMDLIALFLKTAKPWYVAPPSDIKMAALYYTSLGAHVIPMRRAEKLPLVKWKEYQDRQPTLSEIQKWNWRHGIILLGTQRYSFLDIDMKSERHSNGLESFDESVLAGWYWERTPSGGYHVYGAGTMANRNGGGVEIIGKGRYIVCAPTLGYNHVTQFKNK